MDFLGCIPHQSSLHVPPMWWIVKPIVSRKRMELLSDLSLIPTFFFLGISLKPNLTSENAFFLHDREFFTCYVHSRNKMLISERYFESCRRGQMVGTKKASRAQKEWPKQTTSVTKISGFHRLQFVGSEDSPFQQDLFVYLIGTRAGGLGVSWPHRRSFGQLWVTPNGDCKGSHPKKCSKNWALGIIFV